ncbi:MAG: enoyl-CoA hydratase-related protein [Firmicutes bacterium]|nr:enoyl-CoA hydratase-related protein [Bacillota bacterium]
MVYSNLTYTREEGLAIITLNRPKAYNAINNQLIDELGHVLSVLEADSKVRVLIITGGSRVFAAGADVTEMMDADTLQAYRHVNKPHRVFDYLEELPLPTIAAINGPALGGGCELALCCDFRIAGESSIIGLPEISLGVIPGAGGTQRLARLIGPSRAKEMIYFGGSVAASEALTMGLVNRVVPDDVVMDEARKMASKLMAKPGVALGFAKESINYGVNVDLITGKKFEKARFAMVFSSYDQKEGMKAFVEKREPIFTHLLEKRGEK